MGSGHIPVGDKPDPLRRKSTAEDTLGFQLGGHLGGRFSRGVEEEDVGLGRGDHPGPAGGVHRRGQEPGVEVVVGQARPVVVECVVKADENVYPMVPPGASLTEMVHSMA